MGGLLHRYLMPLAAILGLTALTAPAAAQQLEFSAWLAELHAEAAGQGISEKTLDSALNGIEPIPRVRELDRKQPETTQTFAEYIERRVTQALADEGKRAMREYRPLLEAIGKKYGVQPRFIVAFWGVETRYGKYGGKFPVIASLVTLAYDARRSDYFRRETINALRIVDQGHVSAAEMTGSWAGAMGQNQFMPSSFLNFAVDYDGDGRRDIWRTPADVFASTANYLARSGWRGDQTWGRAVRVPAGFDQNLVGSKVIKRLSEWQAHGVRRADGGDLPSRDLKASVIQPGGMDGPSFIVYENYRTTLKWNRSDYFAVSVGQLADLIGSS